jgi:hypothetical protein
VSYITVEIAWLDDDLYNAAATHTHTHKKRAAFAAVGGRRRETGMSVMFTLLHRVAPVAGLALALFATIAWIGLVGYALIRLF